MRCKSKILFIYYLILLFLLIGCPLPQGVNTMGNTNNSSGSSSSSSSNGSNTVILPLTVGNTWIYNVITSVGTDTLTTSVLDIVALGGVDTYRVGTNTQYNYYRNYSDGLYKFGDSTEIYTSRRLFIMYPCVVGNTWSFNGGTYRVNNLSRSVTVPAGTFNCIEYYYRRNTGSGVTEHYEYWAPGIGQIRQDVYVDSVLIVSIQLTSYTII